MSLQWRPFLQGVGIRSARPGQRKFIPTGLSPRISIPIGLTFPIPIPARSGRAEPDLSPIFKNRILVPDFFSIRFRCRPLLFTPLFALCKKYKYSLFKLLPKGEFKFPPSQFWKCTKRLPHRAPLNFSSSRNTLPGKYIFAWCSARPINGHFFCIWSSSKSKISGLSVFVVGRFTRVFSLEITAISGISGIKIFVDETLSAFFSLFFFDSFFFFRFSSLSSNFFLRFSSLSFFLPSFFRRGLRRNSSPKWKISGFSGMSLR